MGVKVFFEDEYNTGEAAVAAYRTIRRHFPADDLVVVSAGDFRSDGHFAGIDAEKRAQEQKAVGRNSGCDAAALLYEGCVLHGGGA